MATKRRYYWDACIWISLIQREEGRFERCKYLTERAEAGELEIVTSTFTLAEVYKRNCGSGQVSLTEENDRVFEDYILKPFIEKVQVDYDVGVAARRLLRRHPQIGKPQDAIHVATAILRNVDALHSFDRDDLLGLSGQLERLDGKRLDICPPPEVPDPNAGTLLEGMILDGGAERDDRRAAGEERSGGE